MTDRETDRAQRTAEMRRDLEQAVGHFLIEFNQFERAFLALASYLSGADGVGIEVIWDTVRTHTSRVELCGKLLNARLKHLRATPDQRDPIDAEWESLKGRMARAITFRNHLAHGGRAETWDDGGLKRVSVIETVSPMFGHIIGSGRDYDAQCISQRAADLPDLSRDVHAFNDKLATAMSAWTSG